MKILVIDDEQLIRWSLEKHFSNKAHKVFSAESGEEGIKLFKSETPDITFLDNKLPGIQGLDVIGKIKSIYEDAVIVFMTAHGSIETAVNAMKFGASDYITKPFTLNEVDLAFDEVSQKIKLNKELKLLRSQQSDKLTFDNIVGDSVTIRQIVDLARKIAATETTTILLLGESGTGKDMFARAIHNESNRSDKPFVTINCSTLPDTLLESELFGHEKGAFTDAKKLKKGFFEVAEGGTVFLDEIGEINANMQVKLLGVLENRVIRRLGGTRDIDVDVRIVAATNKNMAAAVENGNFREDLYYRLKVFQLMIPPLRDHKPDIKVLAEHFIHHFNRQFQKKISGFAQEAIDMLTRYDWPGNVRELRNVMERAVILEAGDKINIDSLPAEITQPFSDEKGAQKATSAASGASLFEVEKQMLLQALESTNHNQTQAAKKLGISRDTLRYRMKKFGI